MIQGRNNIGMFKDFLAIFVFMFLLISFPAYSSPEEDLEELRSHFDKRFPNTPFKEFKNGVYSIDAPSR